MTRARPVLRYAKCINKHLFPFYINDHDIMLYKYSYTVRGGGVVVGGGGGAE